MKLNRTSIAFLSLLLICNLFTVSSLFNTDEISIKENRKLQSYPELNMQSYLNGKFFRELESFFYDHFPLRDDVLELVKIYDFARGIQPKIMALDTDSDLNEKGEGEGGKSDEKSAELSSERQTAQEDFSKYKTRTQNLSVISDEDRLISVYQFDEKKISRYADALNQFAQKLPEKVRMYSLLTPTYVGLTDGKYKDYSDPQSSGIEYSFSLLHPGYQRINVFPALYEKKDEYIYFRSDHHWTQLGAYYAALEFSLVADIFFPEIEEYELHSFEGFLGYLYSKNQIQRVADNPDRLDAYLYPSNNPEIEVFYYKKGSDQLSSYKSRMINLFMSKQKPTYGMFLSGDYPLIIYQNPNPQNGRNLMIVKDSYANAFIPWLAQGFNKIVVIDPRHFKENIYEIAKREEITDFLVLNSIKTTISKEFVDFLNQLSSAEVPTEASEVHQ